MNRYWMYSTWWWYGQRIIIIPWIGYTVKFYYDAATFVGHRMFQPMFGDASKPHSPQWPDMGRVKR